jgi:CBS domain containing-hemolysin-like protein
MPIGGEAFDYEGRRFVVEKMDGHRIATVRIEPLPTAPASTSVSPASVQRAGD